MASAGDGEPAVGRDGLGGGREPAGRLRLGGVARDALLRLALDHRRDVDVQPLGLPDLEHGDGAGEPLDQRVVDRLVAEHARGGGALLAGVDERGLHERGHDLVEIGVGVDDHAVLAAHLGDHALQVALAGRRLRGGADDLLPDRGGAGERDRVHARVGDQPRADLALAGQQRERVGGDARGAQRLDEHVGAARRLLGGLEHDGVAGGERGGGHPARDRDREVPRRDHRDDAARPVAERVALAGDLEQLLAGRELDRAARVVLEEVDRLADVAVGLGPRLGALAHLERGDREPALAQPRGGAEQHRGAAGGGRRRPRPRSGGGRERRVDLGVGGGGRACDDAVRRAGVGRDERVARPGVVADPDGHRERSGRVVRGEGVGELRADGRPAQLQHGLVGERLHRGGASSSSSGTPFAWSARNDSLLVFSSSRRTR